MKALSLSEQPLEVANLVDNAGRPAGGYVRGTGIDIKWQEGPLRADGSDEPATPNGAFVEDVVWAAIQRIQHYNESQFRCRENSLAITHLENALLWLRERTAERTLRNVEGTHTV